MESITIWHNSRCSKSRDALRYLEEKNLDIHTINYLEADITKDELKKILLMLGINARDLMRTKEDIYSELHLENESDEEKLIDAMLENRKLIERPIIIKDNKAVIARPLEKVEELF